MSRDVDVRSRTPHLFVVSGPSGVGKGTLCDAVRAASPHLGLTVSATTRDPRPGEKDGVAYYFMTQEHFDELVKEGKFLEHAHVHGHSYGTLYSEIDRLFAEGSSVMLEIDVQGALQVKERMPEAVLIFIKPPSLEVLEARLRGRGTEDEKTIALRLHNAQSELLLSSAYTHELVNDQLDVAVATFKDIIDSYELQGRYPRVSN